MFDISKRRLRISHLVSLNIVVSKIFFVFKSRQDPKIKECHTKKVTFKFCNFLSSMLRFFVFYVLKLTFYETI